MDFINLESARLKDLFGTELGDGCPSLQTPPGRSTRTFPRVNLVAVPRDSSQRTNRK